MGSFPLKKKFNSYHCSKKNKFIICSVSLCVYIPPEQTYCEWGSEKTGWYFADLDSSYTGTRMRIFTGISTQPHPIEICSILHHSPTAYLHTGVIYRCRGSPYLPTHTRESFHQPHKEISIQNIPARVASKFFGL